MEQVLSRTQNQISLRAVAAGCLITVALTMLFLSLANAAAFWKFETTGKLSSDTTFYLCLSTAWIVAVFVGGFFAAVAAHSANLKDAALNALIVWAGTYLLFLWFVANFSGFQVGTDVSLGPSWPIWGEFACSALSLLSAFAGCLSGTKTEIKIEYQVPNQREQATEEALGLVNYTKEILETKRPNRTEIYLSN